MCHAIKTKIFKEYVKDGGEGKREAYDYAEISCSVLLIMSSASFPEPVPVQISVTGSGSGWKGPLWATWPSLPAQARSAQNLWHRTVSRLNC